MGTGHGRAHSKNATSEVALARTAADLLEDVKILDPAARYACQCGHVHSALTARLKEVDDRLRELRGFRSELAALVRRARAVGAESTRSRSVTRYGTVPICEIVEGASTTELSGARFRFR